MGFVFLIRNSKSSPLILALLTVILSQSGVGVLLGVGVFVGIAVFVDVRVMVGIEVNPRVQFHSE